MNKSDESRKVQLRTAGSIGTVPIDFLPLFKGEKTEGQRGL